MIITERVELLGHERIRTGENSLNSHSNSKDEWKHMEQVQEMWTKKTSKE